MPLKKNALLSPVEEKNKLNELRSWLGVLSESHAQFCSDACLYRYLRATNWNKRKSGKMIKDTLKWREQYKPHQVNWEEMAKEAETGKIYRAGFHDKDGRTVLVMRPGAEVASLFDYPVVRYLSIMVTIMCSWQNTSQLEVQIRYLVYCMEKAIMNLPPDQEQMVWLVDFEGWNMSMIPLMTVRETVHVLQNHYPERLAYAILYNPPKVFEMLWTVVKPFLDPNTQTKAKFVYAKDRESQRSMETLFNMDKLECAFGGKSMSKLDKEEYASIMKGDGAELAL